MKTTKCVIIGSCGHINYALQDIRRYSELLVCGISTADSVDINKEINEQIIKEFNCHWFDDFRIMLDQLKPDVAIIATRFDLNGPVSLECLRRGINCFTEKSIAHSFDILEKLRDTAEKNGATIIGMHGMRYKPEFYTTYQAINNGLIGSPMLFTGQKSYKFGQNRPEFYRKRVTYGGTILWVAIHVIDLAYWLLGDITVLQAHHSNRYNFNFGECEVAVAVSMTFASGALGVITADYFQPQSDIHGDDALRLAGENGVIKIADGRVWLTTHNKSETRLSFPPPVDFFRDYCQMLQGNGNCLVTMKDTFLVTEIALKARKIADDIKNLSL